MKSKKIITIVFIILLSITLARAEGLFKTGDEFGSFEKARFFVKKPDLNKPVSPYNVYFYVETSGNQNNRNLSLIVTSARPSTQHTKTEKNIPAQIKPYMVLWQIRNQSGIVSRQWEPHFENRTRSGPGDNYFTTTFSLPESELKQSHLLIYFEDVNNDNKREDAVFDMDMTDFDWSQTSVIIYKPIVQ